MGNRVFTNGFGFSFGFIASATLGEGATGEKSTRVDVLGENLDLGVLGTIVMDAFRGDKGVDREPGF